MTENRGFGKSGRNEGYKKVSRAISKTDVKGSNYGAPRSTDFRGRSKYDQSGSKPAGSDGYQANAGEHYGSRPKYGQSGNKGSGFEGRRAKYTPGDGRPVEFGGDRNRKQDAGGYKGGFRTEKPQGFSPTNVGDEKKGIGYKRYNKSESRPDSQKDDFRRQEDSEKKVTFVREEQIEEFQGDLDKLEGRNSVLEALKAGRSINRIFVAKGDREGSVNQIIAMARERHILIQEIDRNKMDTISVTHAHQGVIALTAAKDYVEVEEILAAAVESGRAPFIIILDEITDSHNLGSILRTANAAGVHGVIIPKRRAIGLTSVVSKASAGAIEYVPVARVTNIVQTIEKLKKENIWVVGTDSIGDKPYYERDLTGPIALVIGSEGEGMGKLVRESCDFIVNIPMEGQISSLNAAVAGAIVTYDIVRQRSIK